jgi:hypothetical protein
MDDWLDDPNLSNEERMARFEALEDGGELEFADPLNITIGVTNCKIATAR